MMTATPSRSLPSPQLISVAAGCHQADFKMRVVADSTCEALPNTNGSRLTKHDSKRQQLRRGTLVNRPALRLPSGLRLAFGSSPPQE